MIRVLPPRVARIVDVLHPVVFYTHEFHCVFFQILDSTRKSLMDHRISKRLEDRDARRIARLIILRLDPTPIVINFNERFLIRFGKSSCADGKNGYVLHRDVPMKSFCSWRLDQSSWKMTRF